VSEERVVDWKAMALECINALRLMRKHYFDDLIKGNPSYMRHIVLQDYALMNEAFVAMRAATDKYRDVTGDEVGQKPQTVAIVVNGGMIDHVVSEGPTRVLILESDLEVDGHEDDYVSIMVTKRNGHKQLMAGYLDESEVDPEFCTEYYEKYMFETFCPDCHEHVKGVENLTSLSDHGRCFDCHKKWQLGEIAGESEEEDEDE